jgi:uncharacterized protein with von Willebrand factor type A (vWA) domain
MSQENIMYDVKKWPAFMYRQERKENNYIRQAENKGQSKSTRWPKVMQEGFSCLLDPQTKQLEDPPKPGFEVEQTALENMVSMQEFKALQEYTRGDEHASGEAITTLAKAVADKLTKRESNRDVDKLKDDVESLQQMVDSGADVEKQLDKAQNELSKALKEQSELARGIDQVGVRVAVREAARQAMGDIQEERQTMSSLSWGNQSGAPVDHKNPDYRKNADRLKKSDKLKRIAKEAGRQRALACQKQAEKSHSAKVEVDSIETGDELSRMLGSELMLLVSDDETDELMFCQRYADKQCLQLKLSGKESKQQGPIIFVVDTSGSQNPYEVMTKATVLAMLDVARIQKRSFGVVWFDSHVSRVDYLRAGDNVSTSEIMSMLEHWTSGGTNFETALDMAVQMIHDDGEFSDADIIMVTDGACNTSDGWDQRFKTYKQDLKFTMYSVLTHGRYQSTVQKWSDQVWQIADLMSGAVQDKVYSI